MKNKHFGARLALLREEKKLSIRQVATLAGIDYMQVHRYESGKTQPTLDSAARLAKALKVTVDELANGEPSPEPTFRNERLLEKMRELDQLPPDRQELALRVLETVISGYELETLSAKLTRK